MDATTRYWILLVYCAVVIVLVAGMIAGSYVLGGRRMDTATGQPFESGVVVVGDARFRFPVQYYLVAMFFVIFDLESAFIFAWASAVRAAGWQGYLTMLFFIAALLAALVYLWRSGALEWGPHARPLRNRGLSGDAALSAGLSAAVRGPRVESGFASAAERSTEVMP